MSASDPSRRDPEEQSLTKSGLSFPVVGIGASAGGIAALQQFFTQMPAGNGMAFVVILHLSPQHESNAAEILQHCTAMRVLQVRETVAIQADHVYVIPPLHDLSMDDGHLSLVPSERVRGGVHAAIDLFFRTLAEVHGERGICVVLSGTGSDGAVGLTRVKEACGITIVQKPDDAEHEGMPNAAIATGKVDIVLPVAEMPQRLLELWDNMRRIRMPADVAAQLGAAAHEAPAEIERAETALSDIMTLLRLHTRHDFRHYKRATVLRRIERRLQVHCLPDLPSYSAYVKTHPAESALLLQDLLIGVTNFFRDREAFEALEREVLPGLFKGRRIDQPVRVWVAACATGEEAYSVAMLLREEADRTPNAPDFQVFATDIDERAIATARAGLYPAAIATDVAPSRLRQFFLKEGDNYRVIKSIREKILFAAHNVLRDPPFSRLDLVCCRNLLIYLERRAQSSIFDMFRFALNSQGTLFLGVSESADAAGEVFTPVDKKNRIFRTSGGQPSVRNLPMLSAPLTGGVSSTAAALVRERKPPTPAEIHRRSLEQLLPPSVLVDAQMNILHLSEGAGQFMEHGSGPLSPSLLSNVSAELRLELRTALYAAVQTSQNVEARDVLIERGGLPRSVHLSVRPFVSEEGAQLALVVFEESNVPPVAEGPSVDDAARQWIAQLEFDYRQLKEQLQSTIEHTETSTEELKASNEEFQAINEELRSATEELETSKEELQSTNEELTTVNFELKMKVEETSLINDDLQNLVASTDIATVFVNRDLLIKRFTPQASALFNLIGTDIGRSLLDITHKLAYPELAEDATQTFQSLRVTERSVRSTDGRFFLARFLPYRTTDDKIVGAVLTFIDLTALRQAEEQVRAGEERLRLAAEATRDFAIMTTNEAGTVTAWNAGARRLFQWREDEIIGQSIELIFTDEDRARGTAAAERRTAREEGRAEDERWHRRKDGSIFYCSGVMTRFDAPGELGFAKIARDMTEFKQLSVTKELLLTQEQTLRLQAQAASTLKDEFLAVMSHELKHPLNLIHANAELLTRTPDTQKLPAVARAGNAIQKAAAALAKIIDDLLDLSRVRTGKMTLGMADVVLNETVAVIVQAAKVEAAERDIDLTLQCDNAAIRVRGDRVRLEQIVWNLLSNALKFTPKGGQVTVALRADETLGKAQLVVEDNGRGIEPAFLPEIFEMFSQEGVALGATERGLGIGLSLVRDLVVAHGGEVAVSSQGRGQGARFVVTLPLLGGASDARVPRRTHEPHPLADMRVLVVDDSKDAAELLAELLRFEGASAVTAYSGVQALERLHAGAFDLMVSDLGMPSMSGYELMSAVRTLELPQRMLSVALSGYGRNADVEKSRAAGFDGHLSKPASVAALQSLVASLL